MSQTLKIEPANRKKKSLSLDLKLAMEKKFFSFPVYLDASYIPYFEGLRDGGIKDAQYVIDFIEKHEECVLSLEG